MKKQKGRSYRRLYIAAAALGLLLCFGPVGAYAALTLNDVRR